MALMRRFQVEANQDGAAEQARLVAHQALAVDPTNAEAHVALGGVAWALGDPVTAAREILAARHENPRLGDAKEICGRMLIEIGSIDAGIGLLQAAAEDEPGMRAHTIVDIARGLALQGRWPDALGLLETPPSSDPSALNTYWLMRARLVAWTRDRELSQKLLMDLAVAPDFLAKTMALGILATTVTGQAPHEAMKFLEERTDKSPKALRRRAFRAQIQAEVAGRIGDIQGGLRALQSADEANLLDIAWLEHCDVLGDLRKEPAYLPILERTRARAKEVQMIFVAAGGEGSDSLSALLRR